MGIVALIQIPSSRLAPGMRVLADDGRVLEVVRARIARRFGIGERLVRVRVRDRDGGHDDGWLDPDALVPIVTG